MEQHQSETATTVKSSALPRRFSKLPAPRSAIPEPASSLKQHSYTNGARPASVSQINSQALPTTNGTNRVLQSPTKTRPTSFVQSTPKFSGASKQPVSSYNAPQSTQEPGISRYGTLPRAPSRSKVQQPSTQLDDIPQEVYDSGTSETSPTSEDQSEGSNLSTARPKRGSLSERTSESLSHVPPSPASARRRSSFFTQPSPISTPHRPTSSVGGIQSISKINYGTTAGNSVRPASPTKRPVTSYIANGTTRRNAPNSQTSSIRPPSAAGMNTALPRPGSAMKTRPTSIMMPKSGGIPGKQTKAIVSPTSPGAPDSKRPAPALARPASMQPASKPRAPVKKVPPPAKEPVQESVPEAVEEVQTPSKSSSALRQQIAEAKAAQRRAFAKAKSNVKHEDVQPAPVDFENIEDPFNQAPKDGKNTLRQRIDQARHDGRLNIAAMSLSTIPDEVVTMYDTESMETSNIPWSELADLTRFVAADNELKQLRDDVFPDKSREAFANDDDPDAKGGQFGGIELLDLHNNELTTIPMGIRQLSQLTTLNLSRNKLDNVVIDIIAQLPQLRHLHLTDNIIASELPDSIRKLTSLETLDLRSNRIVSLPRSLDQMKSLRKLNLSSNRLSSLPFDAFARLPQFAELDASQNAITGALFASTVSSIPTLEVLDVSHNAIASLLFSSGTIALPALTRLDVSRNRLGSFPDISKWTNLTSLLAGENALGAMPKGMTALKDNLRTVVLCRNELRAIDEGIVEMKALEMLDLNQNPIRDRKLLTMDAQEVKRELERRRELSGAVA